VQEVCIYFQNNLYRGNRTYKDNASRFNAFYSPNYPILAEVNTHVEYHRSNLFRPKLDEQLCFHTRMDDNVAIVKIYPGIRNEFLESVFNTKGLRAVVMETFGVGNAPTNPAFINILRQAVERDIIIVNVTQCKGGGGVEMGRYLTGKHLADAGVISGYDMTTEAAVTKVMYLLGQDVTLEEVKKYIGYPLRGELTRE